MHSLRTKITLLAMFVVVLSVSAVTFLSVVFIRSNQRRETDQLLLLLCETGERNLDYYFTGVQKSVERVSAFAESDLTGLDDETLQGHIQRVGEFFEIAANRTSGVLTYYYRIDPAVSDQVKGFWYTNLDGEGFVPHEVTDITLYDTADTSSLVWFTVPKHDGTPIWLPPYITDNLDVRVISYNVPIYYRRQFVGVIGIEIDYTTMAEQVDSIRLFSNGIAFLSDMEGNLFYHPRLDVTKFTDETRTTVPLEAVSDSTFIRYRFDGVEKQAAWLELSNGMRLNVSVPIEEAEGNWKGLIYNILIVAAEVLLVSGIFTMFYTKRITKPLEKLTEAAELVNSGSFDFTLDYSANDELGRLTSTFQRLSDHMREHITDLSKRVYIDALTSVKNKGAFSLSTEELQQLVARDPARIEFAVGVFDCDNLKIINDQYGHDKGDAYLKGASHLICKTFQHSPVFRIGGDEFAVILRNEDYQNREELVRLFERTRREICAAAANPWEEVHLSLGLAVFDPESDSTVIDVVRRADNCMYENKRRQKEVAAAAARGHGG